MGRVRSHQSFETKVDTLDFWQLRSPGSFKVEMNALEVEFLCRVRSHGGWIMDQNI